MNPHFEVSMNKAAETPTKVQVRSPALSLHADPVIAHHAARCVRVVGSCMRYPKALTVCLGPHQPGLPAQHVANLRPMDHGCGAPGCGGVRPSVRPTNPAASK